MQPIHSIQYSIARPWARNSIVFLSFVLLVGCGFALRGRTVLPYQTLAVNAFAGSQIVGELRRNLRTSGATEIVARSEDAQATVNILNEVREKQILTVNRDGRPREYTLRLRVSFNVLDSKGRAYISTTELVQQRDISFNESAVLAKESEEALLFRDMQSDLVQQLLRRLASAPKQPIQPE